MKKLKLDKEQKKALLQTVRATIEKKLFGKSRTPMPALDDEVFSKKYGVFVTLTIKGNLRGCIGYVEGVKPIRDAVQTMALQAAFHDPRFYPLSKDEYEHLEVEISILYPLEPVKELDEIKVGRDGLVMKRENRYGLLLPQVASQHKWNRERFLNETCRKAGMESYCWENGAQIFRFEAEVWNEADIE